MGNSNTKESPSGAPADGAYTGRDRRSSAIDPSVLIGDRSSRNRMSRSELGFLGLTGSGGGRERNRDRTDVPYERRETRQEREARRLERERVARAKERERSMREEHVDGGFLVTLGTYTGTEDFSKPVVRQLQIERKLAPFWRGLNDWSDNWTEHQLIAAARGLPIPAADATPDPELIPRPPPPKPSDSSQNLQNLTVPMGPRTMSAASAGSGSGISSPTSATHAPGRSSPFKTGRAKALAAALSVGSRNTSSTDLAPKEVNLPEDPFVNGQALEVFLYKDATECPICFLTYPPYLNRTRCCDQPICSECFVQIKRADPHLPEHHPDGQARDPNEGLNPEDPPEMLISEPSACPYCQQPEFGVTYEPPNFRRGLAYSLTSHISSSTAMSSQSSLNATLPHSSSHGGRRRTQSLSVNAPNVITTDRVRPDWATKLASARAHQARRAAAATALHTAAFLVGNENEHRGLLRPGRFSRRNTSNNQPGGSGEARGEGAGSGGAESSELAAGQEGRGNGQRRNRMDELEDMMFMEAVRLSLAAEEERKRKEEKLLRKEAKKREKEERKAAKKQGSSPYDRPGSASGSSLSLSGIGRRRGNSAASNLRVEATVQGASQASISAEPSPKAADSFKTTEDSAENKGKGIARSPGETSASEDTSPVGSLPIPTAAGRGHSHLRQMSNASSVGSSLGETPCGSYTEQGLDGADGGNPQGSGSNLARNDDSDRDTGSEPMFNFRSLAEMVGVNIDDGSTTQEDGRGSESPSRDVDGPAARLSQVKEDDKEDEEARAEHVEESRSKDFANSPNTLKASTEDTAEKDRDAASPDIKITAEDRSPTESGASEDKQFGHSSVTERPSQVTQ